jgi:cell wall-associated NlpC family hydrolase
MLRMLPLFAVVSVSACASTGATPQPFPTHRTPPASPQSERLATSGAGTNAGYGYALAGTALGLRGTPYRNGGADPSIGFDCSGLVRYVFEQHGVSVPRSVGDLFRSGRSIEPTALQPGDLVFFDTKGAGASHVGILIGRDEFVHAPSTNGVVRVERIGGGYWGARFVGARRITD